MQAITTKYFGPGNVRGSRIKASCERGSLTVGWNHALNSTENHIAAAKALLAKFAGEDTKAYPGTTAESHHWGAFVSGEIECGKTVHVLIGNRNEIAPAGMIAALETIASNAGESPEWIRARLSGVLAQLEGNR
jgi:hypothetical protein